MTVYIRRRANIKFNLRVYYGKARSLLLLLIGALSILAVGLFVACMVLNSRISRVNIEAGERIYAEELFGEGAYFGADYNKEFINHAGVYYFTAVTSKGERQVRLAVRDTKAPRVVTRDVYFAVGRDENGEIFLPVPFDFVESVYEPDGFKGEFIGGLPELKKPGEYTVRVQFSDASGNKTEVFTVKMIQISDNLPPEVDVSPLIVCPLGEAVEYKPYVAMTDNCIGALTFTVDESQLDINTVGEYAVYVTGRDRVGNESQRLRVTVKVVDSFDKRELDGLLDALVGRIAPEGKSREEICREIYKAVRAELIPEDSPKIFSASLLSLCPIFFCICLASAFPIMVYEVWFITVFPCLIVSYFPIKEVFDVYRSLTREKVRFCVTVISITVLLSAMCQSIVQTVI
jgi:hypothetical protein